MNNNSKGILNIQPVIIDMKKVNDKWWRDTQGMTELEKIKFVFKQLNYNEKTK